MGSRDLPQIVKESFQAPEELEGIIGWLRPDPRQRLIPAWGLGVLLVLIGAGLCAVFFLSDETGGRVEVGSAGPWLLFGGLGSVLLGMLTMVINAIKVLQDERSLAFLVEGLEYTDVIGRSTELLWREVEEISIKEHARGALEVTLSDQRTVTMRLEWLKVELTSLRAALLAEQRRYLMGVPHQVPQTLDTLGLKLSHNAVFNARALQARAPRS